MSVEPVGVRNSRTGVLVLAATNRPEVLDPALLRPGRINRRVVVPRPSEEGRRDILTVHLRNVPVDGDLPLVRSHILRRCIGSISP
jgi:cell division protease FtsH